VLFLNTPAAAGRYVEETFEREAPLNDLERDRELQPESALDPSLRSG
jgi:hypothetical protein